VVLKVLSRLPDPMSQIPSMRVAQMAIRIRAGETSLQAQKEAANKIRNRATRVGLGKAAAENGLSTSRTQPYDYNATPTELVTVPEAADWGLSAKNGAVSHVIVGPQELVIVQVASQSPGGVPPKDDVSEALRQLAQLEARVALVKPAAEQARQALAGGRRLEDAAKAAGATPFTIAAMSRAQPDPRLAQVPEVIGAAFGTEPGKTVGPIETLAGWFLVRVDKRLPADPAAYDQLKAQISQDLITRRQQGFFGAWVAELRSKAKVRDFRSIGS
jgi:parvulin-like peptidyl-prolyl isomerase